MSDVQCPYSVASVTYEGTTYVFLHSVCSPCKIAVYTWNNVTQQHEMVTEILLDTCSTRAAVFFERDGILYMALPIHYRSGTRNTNSNIYEFDTAAMTFTLRYGLPGHGTMNLVHFVRDGSHFLFASDYWNVGGGGGWTETYWDVQKTVSLLYQWP